MIRTQRAIYVSIRAKPSINLTRQAGNVRLLSTNSPKASSNNSLVWKLATFATVGTTFAVVGNYLNDKSWRYEEPANAGPVAPLAQVTSQAYLDVSIDHKPVGRIVLGLYGDVVPKTVANFQKYCHKGYPGTLFHRIIPGFMIQGGQIVPTSSSMTFDDENFVLEHAGPGVLSMANAGRNTNTSQFFISTARTSHLNGRHVVFGSVLEGWDVVKKIEACGTSSGNPAGIVKITDAGVLPVENKQD